MNHPQITHMPCDLHQQHDRAVAARERLARKVLRRRRLREDARGDAPFAQDVHHDAEDVVHAFRF